MGYRATPASIRPPGQEPATSSEVCSTRDAAPASTPFWLLHSATNAVGVDLSAKAIELAITKATDRGIAARFLVADALRLNDLGQPFDTVLDCGLFHVLSDDERVRYVDSLTAVIPPGGRYHMLCFSDRQPGDWGPRRVTQDEIRAAFSDGWKVESIEPAVIDLTWDPDGALAWQAATIRM